MSDLVDQQFPPIHRPWVTEYTDFNYWRQPLQSYEFPVLSTDQLPTGSRSESPSQGTLRRIRQFSLGRAASKGLFLSNEEGAFAEERKVKSMNGQTLQLPSSRSMDDRRAQRRLSEGSIGSMPGSLPKSSGYMGNVFDEEDDELPDDLEAGEAGRELEPDEELMESEDVQSVPEDELFFEDFLATGEMKNVPFL
jgi:phosphatidate phosphatase LPIN